MIKPLVAIVVSALSLANPPPGGAASDVSTAVQSVSALGLDLLGQGTASNANALLSPYSIQSALAMTFAGAAGDTRAQMARVLHYPADETELHRSFAALQRALAGVQKTTAERATNAKRLGGPGEPITLTVANRLFGQQGYDFRQPFLDLARDQYSAPLQPLDFTRNAAAATRTINAWVEDQTRQRIRDLIPPDGLDRDTRLVLVNTIYLKAPWMEEFRESATKLQPFHIKGGAAQEVPTMSRQARMGYSKREGFSLVTIPYSGGQMQFVVLLPDAPAGLSALEAKVTPDILASCASAPAAELQLYLPKFKLEPPLFRLGKVLRALGMKSAFNEPKGSANFDRMAPRKPDDYLYISEVFHKTFLALDEQGTEAAAATAVTMMRATSAVIAKPIEVRVDRPFLFAIQHQPSGACLFLGRVTDPR